MKPYYCAIHVVLAGLLAGAAHAADQLSADFIRPPDAAKAGVWWRWINGNVTREGITRDLTEMSRKGIRSVDIFDVGGGGGVGPAGMMGPQWRELFKHTLTEAARLGVEVRVVAAAGWGIGGPWVGAADAAKKLSYSEIQVDGPCRVSRVLPKPLGAEPFYQDVAVVAFREKDHAPARPAQVVASSEIGGYCDEQNTPAENVADADPDTCWKAKQAPSPAKPAWVELRFHEPLAGAELLVVSPPGCGPKACELQASTDGKTFTKVAAFDLVPGENKPVGFPPVQAVAFRLQMTSAHVVDVQLAEVCVLRQGDQSVLRRGIKWWQFKSATRAFWDWPKAGPAVLNEEYAEADVMDCRSADTIDLTAKMAADGKLVWDVPPGRWVIARFGMTLVGETPRAMSAALKGGYEADPYSRKAADLLYDSTVKILLADAGPVARKALSGVLLDSYEIGASAKGIQGTWTEGFREEFRRRNGYDLITYLPALTRRVVDGRGETDRFLWDYRQVLAGLYLDFFSQMTARAHRDGLQMRAENGYGTYPFPHIDGLAAYGQVDVPMGEFWFSGGGHRMGSVMSQHFHYADSVRTAASAAHIYGKPLVAAEALTIADGTRQAPGAWKSELDAQFCNGLNNAMIHLWSHQPDVTARPGLFTYDAVNANMTWWEQSSAFFDYAGRCQSLLRHGRFAADFCYFLGEDTARFVPGRKQVLPALPAGCDFDGINAEVILSRLSCKDGLATLPDGQTYRYLVLPSTPGWNVTGPVLKKLSQLVHSGLTIIGPKPGASPRLGETAEQTQKSREIADALWGNDAQAMVDRKVGKGRVIAGKELAKILADDGVAPDVAFVGEGASSGDSLSWIHRRSDDTDLYFLANASSSAVRQTVSFRIAGRQPELWDPVTGQQRKLPDFESANGSTTVPLEFEPNGSVFVVFRKQESAVRNQKAAANFQELKPVLDLTGPWKVSFDPAWFYPDNGTAGKMDFQGLGDWSQSQENAVRHYSGTAIYRKTFDLAEPPSKNPLFLSLGQIKEIATVRLNGKSLGTVWCAPWRVEITQAVRSGTNELEIEVANLWQNRLIGDAALPPDKRVTRTNLAFSKNQPLLASGLLGPVRVMAAEKTLACRDLYSDTWVAQDALGRNMPSSSEVGPIKTGQRRVAGMFYITWHRDVLGRGKGNYDADVSRLLLADPEARLDANHPLWKGPSYHWAEPEVGYFLSKDEYVIRKDMSMLSDAGVDMLVVDVTNAVRYWDEWEILFSAMQKMKAEGNKVPQFCFWAFNGPVITVVQDLFDRIYKTEKYKDLWFEWDGKPLLLYNGNPKFDANGGNVKNPNPHYEVAAKTDSKHPHFNNPDFTEEFYKDYTQEVKSFFTLRTMWWGYHQWAGKRFVGTEDNWSFGYDLGDKRVRSMNPDDLVSTHKGKKEEAAVTPAQHASSMIGKSWSRAQGQPQLNQYDLPVPTLVPWLGKTVANPEAHGIYFQERWEEALKSDPQFLYINDWNEWTAGKYQPKAGATFPFMRRASPFYFVDQYNAEFTRCIQPMKGGYTDNYYMQMAQNLRRYKGARPIPEVTGTKRIKIDGDFTDWADSTVEYRDTAGDTAHRDYKGYGGLHYTDDSGRNDIVTGKVAVARETINFYAEAKETLTPHTGNHWMLLLIDADQNPATGWYGYDFLINKQVVDGKTTTLQRYETNASGGSWVELARLDYRCAGQALELAVPRKLLGLTGDAFTFDFKWCDNPADLKNPISLCVKGDSAPNRRFNYRCIWKKGE